MAKSGKKHWFRYLLAGLMAAATIGAAGYRLYGIKSNLDKKVEEDEEDESLM